MIGEGNPVNGQAEVTWSLGCIHNAETCAVVSLPAKSNHRHTVMKFHVQFQKGTFQPDNFTPSYTMTIFS